MSNTSSTTVIIAVPGGQETQELSLQSAQEAFARGEIEPTRWAWCRTQQNWKPIAELPEFQFAVQPKVAVEPVPVAEAQVTPVVKARPVLATAIPAVQARQIVQTVPRVKSGKELVVKEESTFSFFKLFVIGLGFAIIAVVGVNYVLVDQPLSNNLAKTSFSTVPVYSHLGAFFQPDTIIIHLQPSPSVTPESLPNFLISLAQSTPAQPINHQPFSTVGLTSAWTSQLLMSGSDWQTLAGMINATDDAKKEFILTRMGYPDGERLLTLSNLIGPDAQVARRNQAWQVLTSTLVRN